MESKRFIRDRANYFIVIKMTGIEDELNETIDKLEKQDKAGEMYSFEYAILVCLKTQREILKKLK